MSLACSIVTCVVATSRAWASPVLPDFELVEPAKPTAASYRDDEPVDRSYLVPALEGVALLVSANLVARIAGEPWAEITPSTMWTNLTGDWVYDDDVFSVNQLAHPYGGALLFTSARSSGLGFWTSAAYTLTGSLLWETLLENEPPSLNDQITTSIAGAFLGESLERWGRAVLWGGGPAPTVGRQVLASAIDPAAAVNRRAFGAKWRHTPPPQMHAYLAVGVNRPLVAASDSPFHGELAVGHGLPSDPRFVPRVPFDHFDLRGQLAASSKAVTGYLDVRGIIVGSTLGESRVRALWGLYGTYDYWDAEGVRAGAIGVGPGVAVHAAIGDRNFFAVSAVAAFVPWGAAGGTGDVEGVRDYHHGPGAAEIVELKLGQRGLGVVRLTGRAIEIAGKLNGRETETVVLTSASAMVAIATNHALGVEIAYSARRARFTDATLNDFDQTAQLRFMYALTSDRAFAGGSD